VTAVLQRPTDFSMIIKLAIHDDTDFSILAGDGLIAGRKINDGQASVPEADALVAVDPMLLAVGAAMP